MLYNSAVFKLEIDVVIVVVKIKMTDCGVKYLASSLKFNLNKNIL
jgi:hypothetical protein